jgi:glycosyltransferase involved in cell wall biosynthesis
VPVIASRLGAMAEIVEDGVTGLHFRLNTAPINGIDRL